MQSPGGRERGWGSLGGARVRALHFVTINDTEWRAELQSWEASHRALPVQLQRQHEPVVRSVFRASKRGQGSSDASEELRPVRASATGG
jgi:hypothetical protein